MPPPIWNSPTELAGLLARIVQRIPVSGASLLHNITIDPAGVLYVSDMFTGKVHRIEGQQVTTYVENPRSPSGLAIAGKDLYVFTGEGLLRIDPAKNTTVISKGMDGRANGLQMVNDREFLLTSWGGFVYYVNADGSNQLLLDTRAKGIPGGINLCEPKSRTMYMTTDQRNTVIAFRVK